MKVYYAWALRHLYGELENGVHHVFGAKQYQWDLGGKRHTDEPYVQV